MFVYVSWWRGPRRVSSLLDMPCVLTWLQIRHSKNIGNEVPLALRLISCKPYSWSMRLPPILLSRHIIEPLLKLEDCYLKY